MSGCGGRDIDPAEPLSRRVRRAKIDAWLGSLHCVRWPSGGWDITDPKERAEAIAFIEQIVDGVV